MENDDQVVETRFVIISSNIIGSRENVMGRRGVMVGQRLGRRGTHLLRLRHNRSVDMIAIMYICMFVCWQLSCAI